MGGLLQQYQQQQGEKDRKAERSNIKPPGEM
jgi:hypothetical protein